MADYQSYSSYMLPPEVMITIEWSIYISVMLTCIFIMLGIGAFTAKYVYYRLSKRFIKEEPKYMNV